MDGRVVGWRWSCVAEQKGVKGRRQTSSHVIQLLRPRGRPPATITIREGFPGSVLHRFSCWLMLCDDTVPLFLKDVLSVVGAVASQVAQVNFGRHLFQLDLMRAFEGQYAQATVEKLLFQPAFRSEATSRKGAART